MNKHFKIVMLVSSDESSNIIYNALKDDFEIVKVIMEEPVSKKRLIANRIKRLGYLNVFGQILFILFNKLLLKFSKSRIQAIKRKSHLDDSVIDDEKIIHVHSINDGEVIDSLKKINPDAVVVNGTRIISEKVLLSIVAPFINTHVGITPKYRGVHGGYWALAEDDIEHCGVTVHLVDTGVDTGSVIFQVMILPEGEDNFNTYPYLQIAKAVPLMKKALKDVQTGTLHVQQVELPSRIWYHPTLLAYVTTYLKRGIK